MRILNLLLFLLLATSGSYAQNYNLEAYQFHQAIEETQENIGKEIYYFNERATDLNLKILNYEINRSIKFLDSLKIYNNETTYYNAAKKLLAMYNDIASNEYVELLHIIEDPELEAKDFKAKKLQLFESIKKKTAAVYPQFNEVQQQYCKKYSIKIE